MCENKLESAKFLDDMKEVLYTEIDNAIQNKDDFVRNPGKDFSRKGKLGGLRGVILFLLSLTGLNMTGELGRLYGYSVHTPTVSAVCQMRYKLSLSFFVVLFQRMVRRMDGMLTKVYYRGYRLVAIDGSDQATPSFVDDILAHIRGLGEEGRKALNLHHFDCMIDIRSRTILDARFCGKKEVDERKAAAEMLKDLKEWMHSKIIAIMDRGYESYDLIYKITKIGHKYVIRAKDVSSNGILSALDLPTEGNAEFDTKVKIILVNRQTKEVQERIDNGENLKYVSWQQFEAFPNPKENKDKALHECVLEFRVVRFKLKTGNYECLITNLSQVQFSVQDLMELYGYRWTIETGFRRLKYSMNFSKVHSRKRDYLYQEFYTRLILFNICIAGAYSVPINTEIRKKYRHQINFATASGAIRSFILDLSDNPQKSIDTVQYIAKHTLPIIDDRVFPRNKQSRRAYHFHVRGSA